MKHVHVLVTFFELTNKKTPGFPKQTGGEVSLLTFNDLCDSLNKKLLVHHRYAALRVNVLAWTLR